MYSPSTMKTKKTQFKERTIRQGSNRPGDCKQRSNWIFILPARKHLLSAYSVLDIVLGLTHKKNSKDLRSM